MNRDWRVEKAFKDKKTQFLFVGAVFAPYLAVFFGSYRWLAPILSSTAIVVAFYFWRH